MISFSGFRFDPKQEVLYQHGKPVDLTQKQAKLLALFLGHPETIFSKEDILDQVWEGRAVSEQVVFQNVSKLRTIISNDAIKTFPKRGYQWQIPLEQISLKSGQPHEQNSQNSPIRWVLATIAAIALFAVVLFVWDGEVNEPSSPSLNTEISFIPIEARFGGAYEAELKDANQVIAEHFPSPAETTISARQFMNSSFMERTALGLTDDQLLMSGILRRIDDRYFLVYRLQGQYRDWQSYIVSEDPNTLAKAVVNEATFIASSKYFSVQNEALVTAELALLHDQHPRNASILASLVERNLEEYNHDVAGAYIDKLLTLSQEANLPAYYATAKWLKGQKAIALQNLENAQSFLMEAASLAEEAELLFIQSEIVKSLAEVSLQQGNYEGLKNHLLHAASLSRLAGDPVKEVRAYTLLSIMSAKLGYADEKYEYLHQAKSLLADDLFDRSHYMLVHYHFALFSDEVAERERWYQVTLSHPITPENEWVYESAADNLVELLIDAKRWDEAMEVAQKVPAPATSNKLIADIHIAQGQTELGIAAAQESFTQARVIGDRWVGLPVALLLLENSMASGDETAAYEYRQYIQSNLIGRWQNWEREKLAGLGIGN